MHKHQITPDDIRIIPAHVCGELLTAGIREGAMIYLAYELPTDNCYIVRWSVTSWVCSCKKGACPHKRAANNYKFIQLQQEKEA